MAFGNRRQSADFISTGSSTAGNRSDNVTRWSDMYSAGKGGVVASAGTGPRWLMPAFVIAVIILVVFGFIGGQALMYRGQSETTFINRMLTECDDALGLANSLSRSGGAESAAILGRIRADIHAIDTINEVRNTVTGGGYFIPPYVFSSLYSVIDSYHSNLQLGNVTMQNLTDLVNQLEGLRDMLAELNGL